MASLNVVSAPLNQPTLNPKVQSAPSNVQPSVKVGPAAPQPARLPVVNQPQNVPQKLSVQPPAPSPTINVDNSYRFASLGQRVKAVYPGVYDNVDDGELGKIVATKYPGVYDQLIDSGTPQQPQPQGVGGLKGFGLGAVKGALNTLTNIGGYAKKTTSKIPFIGGAFPLLTGLSAANEKLSPYKENFRPEGTAEKIGFGTEQVAEFFIPGGPVTKGTKVIEGASLISKLPKAAQTITKVAGRAGLEGAGAAAVTAAQGGDESDIKTAALLGGGFSVAAKGVEKILQRIPETAWTSILKRTPTEASKNPNLPKQAAQTGLTGATRQNLANKANQAIQAIEVSLDDLLSKSQGTINTAKVTGYLSDLRTAYAAIPGEQASVKAIDDIATQLLESFKQGKAMSLVEANQLKRNIYNVIAKSYGKGMLEIPAKTEAQKLVAAGLKREIEKVIPEVKSLNERQAVYLQIKKALDKTIARTEGKGIAGTGVGLYDLLIGGIGTGAGAVTGNPLLGLGLVAGKKTGESSLVLSATSKLLTYFDQLSPTKKLLFYDAIKGMVVKGGTGLKSAVSTE